MRIDLRTLEPNPMRDFIVDPISETVVAALKDSIDEHGFWGGIACRGLPDGTIEIAAGHHRVQAAIEAGITEADLFVRGDIDDAEMIRLYATENATQRGNTSTALAGTVASALRFVAKAILTGTSQDFLRGSRSLETLRGQFQTERGIGQGIILDFLNGRKVDGTDKRPHEILGVNDGTVQQQLANLKASGDYARLIAEVESEIAEEEAVAMAAAAAAESERLAREQERQEAEEQERLATLARQEAEERERQAEKSRKEAEAQARAAAQAKKEAQAREKAAKAEAERQQEAQRVEAAEAERLRHEEAAKAAEVIRRREAEAAQAAEVQRQRTQAQAELAVKREAEAEAKRAEFEAMREKKAVASATAKKAATKAAERERTFDFEGVARYLENSFQVQTFREVVTGKGIQPFLAVKDQAALAKHLAALAVERNTELTAAFIRENITTLLLGSKQSAREQTKAEQEQLRRADLCLRAEHFQDEFCRYAYSMATAGDKLAKLCATWPKEVPFPIQNNFRKTFANVSQILDTIKGSLEQYL